VIPFVKFFLMMVHVEYVKAVIKYRMEIVS